MYFVHLVLTTFIISMNWSSSLFSDMKSYLFLSKSLWKYLSRYLFHKVNEELLYKENEIIYYLFRSSRKKENIFFCFQKSKIAQGQLHIKHQ